MQTIFENKNFHLEGEALQLNSGLYTFLNPFSYLFARTNTDLFSKFDKIYFDGIAIVKLFSFFNIINSERLSFDMTSLAPVIFSVCAKESKNIFLIGSSQDEIQCAVTYFKRAYPGLKIIGFRNGFFIDQTELRRVQLEISLLNPDVVVVGMGTPLQERFLVDLKELGWNGTGFTCGGFFHQTAKRGCKYYPDWADKLHLRWVYRIYDEPKLFKRYFFFYPLFLLIFLSDLISHSVNKIKNTNNT